ncbi:Uncharacterised protein [uncultured archaeon]|nr:Uncharacterised protein [uncultured archaeon]
MELVAACVVESPSILPFGEGTGSPHMRALHWLWMQGLGAASAQMGEMEKLVVPEALMR